MATKAIKLQTSAMRFLALGAILVCLIAVYFFSKWWFAGTIAAQSTGQTQTAPIYLGEFAVGLAPSDPLTHYALAVLYEESFLAENLPKSLAEYETAAALSPNDFRLWLALGKAREQAGDAEGAEKAFRRAALLAPNYAAVQWSLGNALLRRGKSAEGFAEIRKAAAANKIYANPAISAAWQAFDGDIAQIKNNLGDSSQTKSALALFLAKQKRFDEAFESWNMLSETEKRETFKDESKELLNIFLTSKKYRLALQMQQQPGGTENFAVGKISNGGFESNESAAETKIFEWQIASGTQPQIGVDASQKRGGNNSLGFVFNSVDGKDFRLVSQMVVVEAGKKYTFETFYKAELKTSATLFWEIAGEADGKILASSAPVAPNADWTSLRAEFTAPEATEAVIIRLAREPCKATVCSISGRIWFDDFSLTGN